MLRTVRLQELAAAAVSAAMQEAAPAQQIMRFVIYMGVMGRRLSGALGKGVKVDAVCDRIS